MPSDQDSWLQNALGIDTGTFPANGDSTTSPAPQASAAAPAAKGGDASATVTIPETTVTGAADLAAYNQGYSDGQKFGQPQSANERRYAANQKSLNSYAKGFNDWQSDNPQPYSGPEIGPETDEQKADKEDAELEEKRLEFIGDLHKELPEGTEGQPETEPIFETPVME